MYVSFGLDDLTAPLSVSMNVSPYKLHILSQLSVSNKQPIIWFKIVYGFRYHLRQYNAIHPFIGF